MVAKTTNRWGGLFYSLAVAQNGAASPPLRFDRIWNLEGIFVRENAENAVIWRICCVSSLDSFAKVSF